MKVVTLVTDKKEVNYIRYMKGSCEYFDLDLVTLCPILSKFEVQLKAYLKKINIKSRFNFARKIKYLRRYIDTIDEDELVLFTDAYDALFVSSQEEILSKYAKFGKSVVFTGEKRCYPDVSLGDRFPAGPAETRYINSGGLIGRAGQLKKCFAQMGYIDSQGIDKRISSNDQYIWHRVFLDYPNDIAIDYEQEIFLSAPSWIENQDLEKPAHMNTQQAWKSEDYRQKVVGAMLDAYRLENNRLVVRRTGKIPCVIHFNGAISRIMGQPELRGIMPWLVE